jgi:hypothetical protein
VWLLKLGAQAPGADAVSVMSCRGNK